MMSNFVQNRLMWVAVYRDNSVITQYNANSTPKTLDEIPRLNLKRISLLNHDGRFVISQDYLPEQTPLYRIRTAMRAGSGIVDRFHILGWTYWEDKHPSKIHVAFINEYDLSIEMGHFVDGVGLKYPIVFNDVDFKPIIWS